MHPFPQSLLSHIHCTQFLSYHHLPRKLKSSQEGAGFWLYCCYLTAAVAGIQAILRGQHFPEHRFPPFSFALCSQISRLSIDGKSIGSSSAMLSENLFTPATQTSKPCQNRHQTMITWLPRWRKKISSSNNGCSRRGRQWPALPSMLGTAVCLSGCSYVSYTSTFLSCSISSMHFVAEHCKSITFVRGLSVWHHWVGTAKDNNTDALHGQKELNKNLPLYLLLQLGDTNLWIRKIPLVQLPLYLHS